MDCPVHVVLPAGGSGERFGGGVPKQYRHVADMPLFLYTVEAFHRIPWIKNIVLPVSANRVDYVQDLLEKYNFTKAICIEGGRTRHRSINNGIRALENVCAPDDIVLVQDVTRMFIDEELAKSVAMAAKETGASGVWQPLTHTVIRVDENEYLGDALDSKMYKSNEKPQGFIYSVIRAAYKQGTDADFDLSTGCLPLVQKYMHVKVKLVKSTGNLFKITYKSDLLAAEGMMKDTFETLVLGEEDDMFKSMLRKHLVNNDLKVAGIENGKFGSVTNVIYMYKSPKDRFITLPRILDVQSPNNSTGQISPEGTILKNGTEQSPKELSDFAHTSFGEKVKSVAKPLVIHIINGKHVQDKYLDFVQGFQAFSSKELKENDVIHYCVVRGEEEDNGMAMAIITTLLKRRDVSLNGQVLLVPK